MFFYQQNLIIRKNCLKYLLCFSPYLLPPKGKFAASTHNRIQKKDTKSDFDIIFIILENIRGTDGKLFLYFDGNKGKRRTETERLVSKWKLCSFKHFLYHFDWLRFIRCFLNKFFQSSVFHFCKSYSDTKVCPRVRKKNLFQCRFQCWTLFIWKILFKFNNPTMTVQNSISMLIFWWGNS